MAKKGRPRKHKRVFEVSPIFTRGLKSDSSKVLRDYFLAPFTRALDGEPCALDAINYFFNVFTRDIFWVKVTEEFRIPGDLYITGSRLESGTGPRQVRLGEVLIVRTDKKLDYVDIERIINDKEYTFRLTEGEYEWLKGKIKVLT